MKYEIGERLELKKKHPCGSNYFLVKKTGVDITLECEGCAHRITMPRVKVGKIIKNNLIK